MLRRNDGSIKSIIIFPAVCFAMVFARSSIYPSVYWNPWNPLFACKDPTINVRIGDTINFLCPSDEYNFYIPFSHVNPIYENLYYLDDNEEKYNDCDARGARRLLRCDDKASTPKLYTISFRDIQTSEKSMKFDRGKDYYLIGTGFRETNRLDNLVNGSCRGNGGNKAQFRLRLKIHVCENDDKCNICKSAGCYYEKCGAKCEKWEVHKSEAEPCGIMEKRRCVFPYLDTTKRIEYRPRVNFSRSECEENRTTGGSNDTNTGKGSVIGEPENEVPIYKILVVVLAFLCLALFLFICIKSAYFKGMSKKLNNMCFLIGGMGKNKNSDESHKLSTDDGNLHNNDRLEDKKIYQDLLDVKDKKNDDIDISKKIEKISNLCKDLLANASDEIEKSKTHLIIDLLHEMQRKDIKNGDLVLEVESGDSGIDDPDGRTRGGSDNLAYRNSTNTLPKKKTALLPS